MRFIHIIIFFICTSSWWISTAQGLRFTGSDSPIDSRTSYDVFKYSHPKFSKEFDLTFDLALYPEVEIGYIFRIRNGKDGKVIYNLFYDGQGDNAVFQLNEEGRSSLIRMIIPTEQIREQNWQKLNLHFALDRDSLTLTIGDYTSSAKVSNLSDSYSPFLQFGKSGYFIDVPSFAIKNLSIGNHKKYKFPLTERDGTSVSDTKGRTRGEVSNPIWLMNDSYQWSHIISLKNSSIACAGYDLSDKEIYFFNQDSIFTYNIKSLVKNERAFSNRCPVNLRLGTNFIDTAKDRIYAYEVWYDPEYANSATVASLDINTMTWTARCYEQMNMQLHHHGAFFDRTRSRYTIFGGFGNMHYSGKFYSYDLQVDKWYEFPELNGDFICPRYFTSLGYDSQNSLLYVFGGMGNESGEQVVGRRYLYDFYAIDITTSEARLLWSADLGNVNMVPVRNLLFDGKGYFYTLCYPESHTDSELQLYRFSVADGSYEKIGDTIPIHSDRITTNANLYYDRSLEKLIATVQESDDDISSTLKVYTLSLPTSETIAEFQEFNKTRHPGGLIVFAILIGALILGITLTALIKRHFARNGSETISPDDIRTDVESIKDTANTVCSSINLFGLFSAIDREGSDVSDMFTEKQFQMLCILLKYSTKGGISSANLSSILWPGKPVDKVKSSRNATISYLRRTLTMFDDIELVYRNGVYTLEWEERFHCDYLVIEKILSNDSISDNDIETLVSILSKGKFLSFENDPIFDEFKAEVERKIVPVISSEIIKRYEIHNYKGVLEISDILFAIDPLNTNALRYMTRSLCRMKRLEDALVKYQMFTAEYRKTYGEEYPYQFDEI